MIRTLPSPLNTSALRPNASTPKGLTSNAKLVELSVRVFERGGYVFHASGTRSVVDSIEQVVEGGARAFGFEANGTVGFIAHPACAAERLRAFRRKMAKANPLNASCDSSGKPFHAIRCIVSGMVRRLIRH